MRATRTSSCGSAYGSVCFGGSVECIGAPYSVQCHPHQRGIYARAFSVRFNRNRAPFPVLTRFLRPNRYPAPDHVRGHVSSENAPGRRGSAPPLQSGLTKARRYDGESRAAELGLLATLRYRRRHRLCFEARGRAGWLSMAGREQGKCHANGRAFSQRGDQRDPAAELLRHEIMDDVEPEPGIALRTPGGEEWIENVTLNLLRHAAAVIRESDLDLLDAEATRLDQHVPAGPIGEAVRDGVEDEVGQHLPVGAGEAVQDDIGGHLDCE